MACVLSKFMLLIVCGDVESNPGPGSDIGVRVFYSNIRGLHANLDEFSPPSLTAPYPLLRLPPTEAAELHSLCPAFVSLCQGRIPLLPTEQVGVFLP